MLKRAPRGKKLDMKVVMFWYTTVLALFFLYGGIFGGKHHPSSVKVAARTERPHGMKRPMLALKGPSDPYRVEIGRAVQTRRVDRVP